ncbi:HNH homing endonuclease [Bacillus mojavensis]|uniref:HNH homing endonuclease n=1 Tax=Bacillus mojavensis TaxID=72360 RepID=A0ABX6LZ44_BACMO|nr:NUMOD4 domain-containing protein [Bacillus mojavensis]QJC97159.1 HNH homing endonuclease [Bacillus mojavensis]
MTEEWRTIKQDPMYSVSNKGRVRNNKSGRILKHRPDKKGYDRASLRGKEYKVHRLVAMHFIPSDNCGSLQVNHKDGNKMNNCVDNLEWVTGRENLLHSYRIGLRKHQMKISNYDVRQIRNKNMHYTDVMREFGLSQSHASAIINKTRREVI